MRGKSLTRGAYETPLHAASMRPAHYAREVDRVHAAVRRPGVASMRPAHYAREVPMRRASARVRVLMLQ